MWGEKKKKIGKKKGIMEITGPRQEQPNQQSVIEVGELCPTLYNWLSIDAERERITDSVVSRSRATGSIWYFSDVDT